MHTLRKYLSWSFAFTSLVCLQIALSSVLHTIHPSVPRRIHQALLLLLVPAVFTLFAVVFGMAWWAVFKGKGSARGWGIAASLVNIAVSIWPIFLLPRSLWGSFSVILAIFIVALHEGGHTTVGLLLGMKLRAFIVGPFQWRIQDGEWEFHFEPKQILTPGGVTGIVPAVTNFPRWAQLSMLAAGVFVNLETGILALWAASVASSDSAVQAWGFLALFGAWRLVISLMNLVPIRTKDNYSDGAQIYQLLSSGPWADFHRAFSVAGSSLVTPLRPRNYDIEAILRAGRTITRGRQGLLLRLLAYNHFFDLDKIPEAGEALGEAVLIYNQSPSDVPAELLTPFVFGGAYIWRDASTARQWWTHVQAQKVTRFNVDYWLAASALHWIEGNPKDANESWEKAGALAQQLPKAGAYEFDRHGCALLREALDEVPIAR